MWFSLTLLGAALALDFEYLPEMRDPPSRRLYSTMAASTELNMLVSFGGQLDNSIIYNDLWTMDLTTTQWTQQTSPNQIFPSTP